jgi:hypothetical protein
MESIEKNPHLQRIKIEGFKSIKKMDLEMKPINILIGANGAGKSNFIALFDLLRNLSQGKFQIYVAKSGDAGNVLHFGGRIVKKIEIDITFSNAEYSALLEYDPSHDALIFSRDFFSGSLGNNEEPLPVPSLRESYISHPKLSDSVIYKSMQAFRVYHFHDTSETASFKQSKDVSADDYLYRDASNLASFLFRLKNQYPNAYQEIVATIRTVAPFFHDFWLEPHGESHNPKLLLKWIHRDHDEPFSANQLSDGTARFICLATLFLQPIELMPSTIILDEPELGLHPVALVVLAEMIQMVARDRQIICATQSVTLANQFSAEDFIVVDQEKGASIFHRLNESDFSEWLDEYGIGDIWDKNLIGGRPEW